MLGKTTTIHHRGAGNAVACLSLIHVVCLCVFCFTQPARAGITWFGDVVPADPTSWSTSTYATIGDLYGGRLEIDNGSVVSVKSGKLGWDRNVSGTVVVDGAGSAWISDNLDIGYYGIGSLSIVDGGKVITNHSFFSSRLGCLSGSTGNVTVHGTGSTWTNTNSLLVGSKGAGVLSITGSGLVSVAGSLIIDSDGDGNAVINMTSGGMLALLGDADDSLAEFMGLIGGSDAIRYWDYSISDWVDITSATYGDDYTLVHQTEGDLAGYTVLTVRSVSKYDFDEDGDVDGDDFAIFDDCFSGPAIPHNGGDTCQRADFDTDGDVDQSDFGMLQVCFGGEGNDPPAECYSTN